MLPSLEPISFVQPSCNNLNFTKRCFPSSTVSYLTLSLMKACLVMGLAKKSLKHLNRKLDKSSTHKNRSSSITSKVFSPLLFRLVMFRVVARLPTLPPWVSSSKMPRKECREPRFTVR